MGDNENNAISHRLDRIESTLDKLSDAIVAIARAEEKVHQLERSDTLLFELMQKMDARVDQLEKDSVEKEGRINTTEKVIISARAKFWTVICGIGLSIVGTWIKFFIFSNN